MQPLFRVQPAYDLPRLKLLPLREQPAYRVAANSDSCNLPELLAAIIGGPQQIEIAETVLARIEIPEGRTQIHNYLVGSG